MSEVVYPAMYVRNTKNEKFADWLADGRKPIETRTRDVLGKFIGKRVLIIRTEQNKKPLVIGSAFMVGKAYHNADSMDYIRELTMVPKGSQYDCPDDGGKWCYYLRHPLMFDEPIPLDRFHIIKRTRSYALLSY